jgi:two-component system, cell cycle sensor histidine kinase and response regulator CckA
MAMIAVKVRAANGNKRRLKLPDDAPINRILALLVAKLNLPRIGPDRQPLAYKFHHKASGKQLHDDQCFADAGVKEGDVLRLQPEITAGASGNRHGEPSPLEQPRLREKERRVPGINGHARGIMERRQAEKAQRESDELYRTLVNVSPDAISVADINGSLIYTSPKAREMFGDSPDDNEIIGRSILSWIAPEDHERATENIRRLLENGKTEAREYILVRKDGTRFIGETTTAVIYSPDGVPIRIIIVNRDITQRKRAEQACRESEELYRTVINLSPDPIFVADTHGSLIYISQKSKQMFGKLSENEIVGRSILSWVVPEERENAAAHMKNILVDGALTGVEYTLIKNDETHFIGEVSATVIYSPDGAPFRIIFTIRDVTERKQAEEALRLSGIRLRRAELVARLGNWEFTLEDDKVNSSEGAKIIYGVEPEQSENPIYGLGPSEKSFSKLQQSSLPEYRNLLDKALNDLIKEDKPYDVEFKIKRPIDGKIVSIHSIAEYSPEEKRVFGVIQDITDHKREEEERKKLEEQLFQAQRMESIGRLAGGVAHDFNNILGVIIGRAEMALETNIPVDQLKHSLQEILKAGLRSADLVRQLLAFARKQTAIPKILNLNDTISGMLKMLRRLIGEDIDLSWQPGFDLWKVKIDPSQVDQILANLVVNARDAIPGVGTITMRTENAVIDDSVRAETPEFIPGKYVLLITSDTGTGMSKEVREHIFEPFFTTKEVGKGTGLGLSTVYGIVKQNDGFIYVASEPGIGTTLKIYLPRFEYETTQVLSENVNVKPPTGTETILLVEDDEAILTLSKIILEDLGYTVVAAQSPADAIRLAEEHPGDLDLLISDVVMPEMNGREMAEKLTAIRPNLKCLYMSGYTADVIAHRGILDEGIGFIQKPFLRDDFAGRVRQVLDHG